MNRLNTEEGFDVISSDEEKPINSGRSKTEAQENYDEYGKALYGKIKKNHNDLFLKDEFSKYGKIFSFQDEKQRNDCANNISSEIFDIFKDFQVASDKESSNFAEEYKSFRDEFKLRQSEVNSIQYSIHRVMEEIDLLDIEISEIARRYGSVEEMKLKIEKLEKNAQFLSVSEQKILDKRYKEVNKMNILTARRHAAEKELDIKSQTLSEKEKDLEKFKEKKKISDINKNKKVLKNEFLKNVESVLLDAVPEVSKNERFFSSDGASKLLVEMIYDDSIKSNGKFSKESVDSVVRRFVNNISDIKKSVILPPIGNFKRKNIIYSSGESEFLKRMHTSLLNHRKYKERANNQNGLS